MCWVETELQKQILFSNSIFLGDVMKNKKLVYMRNLNPS